LRAVSGAPSAYTGKQANTTAGNSFNQVIVFIIFYRQRAISRNNKATYL
jgi:hypothetical protein